MESFKLNLDKVLFLDTESDPLTKRPECIQYLIGGVHGIIEDFDRDDYFGLKDLWDKAEAVVLFNAPYDLGVLSICFPDNSFKWIEGEKRGSMWDFKVFGNRYYCRKLGFSRNLIKPLKRPRKSKNGKGKDSTPVVDLLKLWSILINDGRAGSISLKNLIKTVLKKEVIEWSEANAKTEAYRLQDVFRLRELTEYFFNSVSSIQDVKNYNWSDWGFIKTPATFTKLAYDASYNEIFKDAKIHNDNLISRFKGLERALETAFNGGLTLSFYRGTLPYCGWVDISGAYVHAIEFLNTDAYSIFDIKEYTGDNWNYKIPNALLLIESNFIFKSINGSLKVFGLKEPVLNYCWYNDIVACEHLHAGYEYKVIGGYEFIPQFNTNASLPAVWSKQKDIEKKTNGKTTFYDFLKFLGNTSYGIRAQRKPFQTKFTNMVIAGMITSTVHSILAKINYTIQSNGFDVLYNDTDSACFDHYKETTKEDMEDLVKKINEAIAPYTVECEGYNKETKILSLKRYVSRGGAGDDKIRLHGKGKYNIKSADIYGYVIDGIIPEKELVLTELAANTERSMKVMLNIYPYLELYKHPFMFCTNVPVEKKNMRTFFEDWYLHIDTKTTFNESLNDFKREFHIFSNMSEACDFFGNYTIDDIEDLNLTFREWDKELTNDYIQ